MRNCIFILNAGHETTTNLIGNALYMLWRYPDEKKILNSNLDLIDNAVEEVLRMQPPNQFGNRQTTRPVELGGMKLDKDINIHMCIGAAKRDPAIFESPNVFDIRCKKRAPTFGVCSRASCLRRSYISKTRSKNCSVRVS